MSRAHAPSPAGDPLTLPELRTPAGLIDARRTAQFAGLSMRGLALAAGVDDEELRQPEQSHVQHGLQVVADVLGLAHAALGGEENVQRWLRAAPRRPGGAPVDLLLEGRAGQLRASLRAALLEDHHQHDRIEQAGLPHHHRGDGGAVPR